MMKMGVPPKNNDLIIILNVWGRPISRHPKNSLMNIIHESTSLGVCSQMTNAGWDGLDA